jgi:hypothetical protein
VLVLSASSVLHAYSECIQSVSPYSECIQSVGGSTRSVSEEFGVHRMHSEPSLRRGIHSGPILGWHFEPVLRAWFAFLVRSERFACLLVHSECFLGCMRADSEHSSCILRRF